MVGFYALHGHTGTAKLTFMKNNLENKLKNKFIVSYRKKKSRIEIYVKVHNQPKVLIVS